MYQRICQHARQLTHNNCCCNQRRSLYNLHLNARISASTTCNPNHSTTFSFSITIFTFYFKCTHTHIHVYMCRNFTAHRKLGLCFKCKSVYMCVRVCNYHPPSASVSRTHHNHHQRFSQHIFALTH